MGSYYDRKMKELIVWRNTIAPANKNGAPVLEAFISDEGLGYVRTKCPKCGRQLTISRFGWSRFKACTNCRHDSIARGMHERQATDLDPATVWKNICERKMKNRQSGISDIDEIAWSQT